jgi:hypothetical protein
MVFLGGRELPYFLKRGSTRSWTSPIVLGESLLR